MIPASLVANTLIAKANANGKPLTNPQLQMLVYLANGYYLATHNRSLLNEEVFAWTFGPVIKSLYTTLQPLGNSVVKSPLPTPTDSQLTEAHTQIIHSVYDTFHDLATKDLLRLCQTGPWEYTWRKAQFQPIPSKTLATHFKSKLADLRPAT
jgi:uncharacterized phage-associated protein